MPSMKREDIIRRREDVFAMTQQGFSTKEIADTLGIRIDSVSRIRHRLDPTPGINFEYEKRKEGVLKLVNAGLNNKQIAQRMGMSPDTVARIRRRLGVPSRVAAPRFSEEEILRAKELLEDGATYQEVARTLGRSHGVVKHHVPGYRRLPPVEAAQFATLGRALARLERRSDPLRKGAA